jgi:hypothetical protein
LAYPKRDFCKTDTEQGDFWDRVEAIHDHIVDIADLLI